MSMRVHGMRPRHHASVAREWLVPALTARCSVRPTDASVRNSMGFLHHQFHHDGDCDVQ